MRTLASIIAIFFISLTLSGCGGDSGCGRVTGSGTSAAASTCGGGGTTITNVASLTVSSSVASVPSDGSSTATITVLAKDANNNALGSVPVTLASSAGTLSGATATTGTNGQITATLSASGLSAGTTITITATSGSVSNKTTVTVVSNQVTIGLTTSAPQIPSSGATNATITAVVRDANNKLLPGVAVQFSATSGGIAPATTQTGVAAGTTDSNGQAAATLTTAGDQSNRTITVTATAVSSNATVAVVVGGTQLTVTGPTSLVLGAQGTYSVALTDSSNTGIASKSVTVASGLKNTLSGATVTTDPTGHATFQMTAANSGTDTLTVAGLGLTTTQSVTISNQLFQFNTPASNTFIPLSTATQVVVQWKQAGTPQVNQPVVLSTTRGVFSGGAVQTTVNTDATGSATATISSTTAGPAIITASGTGVTAQLLVTFVATDTSAMDVQASPANIPISGQSTITATLRDPQNNLVQNQTVNFQLSDTTGGHLSVASAVTNSSGQAQTVYTASTSSSGANGVIVTAITTNSSNVTVSQAAPLTVGGQSVFLSLGTGATISENDNLTQFIMPFTVQAIDSSGNAVNNAAVTLAVHPLQYGKGTYISAANAWTQSGSATSLTPITICPNEDVNQNGILDPGEDGTALTAAQIASGWVFNSTGNQNGKLDPGGVAATSAGTVTTANGGQAEFTVTYPEDHALWVKVQLVATTNVNGTQSSTSTEFVLPMLAKYLTTVTANPPGFVSPYGTAAVCTNPN